jgi:hypothetical protein
MMMVINTGCATTGDTPLVSYFYFSPWLENHSKGAPVDLSEGLSEMTGTFGKAEFQNPGDSACITG